MAGTDGSAHDPTDVEAHEFPTSFRGYDQGAVRDYLTVMAAELRRLHTVVASVGQRAADAEATLATLRSHAPTADEDPGKLVARAHETAARIEAEAAERAGELLREAQDEARRLRAGVDAERERAFSEGVARAEAATADVEARRALLEEEIAVLRASAATEVETEKRRIIGEAQALRERVLSDLGRRRVALKAQVEQLAAAKDRLAGSLTDARRELDSALEAVRLAVPEARAAADAALRRAQAQPPQSAAEIESELASLKAAGLDLVPREYDPEPAVDEGEAEESEAADAGEGGDAAADEGGESAETGDPVAADEEPVAAARRGTGRRVFRKSSVTFEGVALEQLSPIDSGAPDETVRLVEEPDAGAGEPEAGVPAEPEVGVPGEVEEAERPDDEPEGPGEPQAVDEPENGVPVEVDEDEGEPEPEEAADTGAPTEPDGAAAVELEAVWAAPGGDPPEASEASVEPEPVDPEAPVEPQAVDPEVPAEPEARGEGSEIDSLFARLRAEREAKVAEAREVLAEDGDESPVVVPAPELPEPASAAVTTESGDGVPPPGAPDLLERRTSLLAPLADDLARALKRLLADEQNEVLDHLRRTPDAGPATILPGVEEQRNRTRVVAIDLLGEAYSAGASLLGVEADDLAASDDGSLAEVIDALVDASVDALRSRLETVIDDAGGDPDHAGDAVRGAYRDHRARRLLPAVEDALHAACNRGVLAAAGGSRLCWVVDTGGGPCPDADDNALGGAVQAGEAFPTGHRAPPAHPGCRCLLAPASS